MSRQLLVLALVAAGLLAGACSRDKSVRCTVSIGYRDAASAGQLRVPEDLSLPDETDALQVPGPSSPGEGAQTVDGCLENSPAFEAVPEAERED
jgi:uncharacterized lipoprotein